MAADLKAAAQQAFNLLDRLPINEGYNDETVEVLDALRAGLAAPSPAEGDEITPAGYNRPPSGEPCNSADWNAGYEAGLADGHEAGADASKLPIAWMYEHDGCHEEPILTLDRWPECGEPWNETPLDALALAKHAIEKVWLDAVGAGNGEHSISEAARVRVEFAADALKLGLRLPGALRKTGVETPVSHAPQPKGTSAAFEQALRDPAISGEAAKVLVLEAADVLAALRADMERTGRNRDMWREQCQVQAAQLETLRQNPAPAPAPEVASAPRAFDAVKSFADSVLAMLDERIKAAEQNAHPFKDYFGDHPETIVAAKAQASELREVRTQVRILGDRALVDLMKFRPPTTQPAITGCVLPGLRASRTAPTR